MDRLTLKFWAAILVACGIFAAMPWRDIHPSDAVGYMAEGSSLALSDTVPGAEIRPQ